MITFLHFYGCKMINTKKYKAKRLIINNIQKKCLKKKEVQEILLNKKTILKDVLNIFLKKEICFFYKMSNKLMKI